MAALTTGCRVRPVQKVALGLGVLMSWSLIEQEFSGNTSIIVVIEGCC